MTNLLRAQWTIVKTTKCNLSYYGEDTVAETLMAKTNVTKIVCLQILCSKNSCSQYPHGWFPHGQIPWQKIMWLDFTYRRMTNSCIYVLWRKTPLTLWLRSFFCYPSLGTELISVQSCTCHGLFFQCLLFGMNFFFGAHVSRAENWSSAPIYTYLKRRISRLNFRSYVLNLVKINISFFFQRLVDPGRFSKHYQFGWFIGQAWQKSRIVRTDFSAKRAYQKRYLGRFIGQPQPKS